jgi:hypothetical protein
VLEVFEVSNVYKWVDGSDLSEYPIPDDKTKKSWYQQQDNHVCSIIEAGSYIA